MTLFVDTSVWSLAFRRDAPPATPQVAALTDAIERGETLVVTGLVLQELLQGFAGPKARAAIIDRFAAVGFIGPTRQDHIDAAELRNACRRQGIQVGTIDALFAQICIGRDLAMLTADADFAQVARVAPLRLWAK